MGGMEVDDPVLDAEVVEEEESVAGTAMVQAQAASATLFHTEDPALVIRKASEVADILKDVLHRQGLTSRISGREHVQVEGWQTTGSMLGVFAVESWTRPVPGPEGAEHPKGPWGYESRYEARTRDGDVVGAGVARCTRSENTWKNREDFALMSMAQTRATSRALKAPLGWIVALAGYSATPQEEMPAEQAGPEYGPEASEELMIKTHQALAVLVGSENTTLVTNKLHDDAGYFSRIAARAVCHTAAVFVEKFNPPKQEGDIDGDSDDAGDDTDGVHGAAGSDPEVQGVGEAE